VRQVAWYLLRASWLPGVLIAATLIVRYLFDTLAPVHYTRGVLHPRSQIMSQMLLAIFAAAASFAVWRTTHIRTGLLVVLTAALIGGLVSSAGTLVMLAVWHDPATMTAWQTSGGIAEALIDVPILLVPISLVSGTAGAIAAKGLWWPLKRRA
jgi:hypothetical protein